MEINEQQADVILNSVVDTWDRGWFEHDHADLIEKIFNAFPALRLKYEYMIHDEQPMP